MNIKEFFLNNSENIGFLVDCIILIVVSLLVLFFLLLLLSIKNNKSIKERLRSICSCLWGFLSNALLCGFTFFIGFNVREQIIYKYPEYNNSLWYPSIILFGASYVMIVYMFTALPYILVRFLMKHMKRG